MTKAVANVVIQTDTFQTVVERVNALADAMTNQVVTVDSTTYGSNSTGNGSISGSLYASNLLGTLLRGGEFGNTAVFANLQIGFANSTVSSNITIAGLSTNITSNSVLIATTNTTLSSSNLVINTSNAKLSGNLVLAVNSTFNALSLSGNSTDQWLSANVANLTLTTTSFTLTGNVHLLNNATIDGNLYVNNAVEAESFSFLNTGSIVSNTIVVNYSNNDPQLVDAIAIGTNQSAKYTIQVQDAVANEVMMTEISLVYGFSNVYTTEYGSIYSNNQFVNFTANSNTTHARLYSAPLDYHFANNITYKLIRTTLE